MVKDGASLGKKSFVEDSIKTLENASVQQLTAEFLLVCEHIHTILNMSSLKTFFNRQEMEDIKKWNKLYFKLLTKEAA